MLHLILAKDKLDHSTQYVCWKDKNSVFLGCNENFARLVGLNQADDIVGKTDYDLPWSKTESDTYIQDDRWVITAGEAKLFYEENQHHNDGKRHTVLVNKLPFSYNHEVAGVVCIYQDITDFKLLEEKLKQTELSEEKFKAMSALGGMIAHELRTPLLTLDINSTMIQHYLPLLVEGYEYSLGFGKATPIRKDKLEALKQAISQMDLSIRYAQLTITNILKNFHHLSTDTEIELTQVSLQQIIQKAITLYPFDPKEEKLLIIKSIDDIEILGNEQMLTHVLHNLFKNALHAINSKGSGMITLWTTRIKKGIMLSIEDTGIGMSQEQLPHIFEAFYTTKRSTAASIGLGLYFCKHVLHKMGATIRCDSTLGNYTRFSISFPYSVQ